MKSKAASSEIESNGKLCNMDGGWCMKDVWGKNFEVYGVKFNFQIRIDFLIHFICCKLRESEEKFYQ